jgi:hypothetical protein
MNGFSLTGQPPRMTTGSVVDVRRDETAQGQVVKEWQTSESSPTERGEASPDTVMQVTAADSGRLLTARFIAP